MHTHTGAIGWQHGGATPYGAATQLVPTPSKKEKAARRKNTKEDSAMVTTPTKAAAADSVAGVPGHELASRINLPSRALSRLAIVAGNAYRENSEVFFQTTLKQIVEDKVKTGDVEQESRAPLMELCELLGCNLENTSTHVDAILIPNVIRNWKQQARVLVWLELPHDGPHQLCYMLCRSTTTQTPWTLERRCRT